MIIIIVIIRQKFYYACWSNSRRFVTAVQKQFFATGGRGIPKVFWLQFGVAGRRFAAIHAPPDGDRRLAGMRSSSRLLFASLPPMQSRHAPVRRSLFLLCCSRLFTLR